MTFTVVLWKIMITLLGKMKHTKKRKLKWANLELKSDLLKNSRSQRYSNYEGFVKSMVATRTLAANPLGNKTLFLSAEMVPKSNFSIKIGTGTL